MKIGDAEIEASYEVAKKVYVGLLDKEAGAIELNSRFGMNIGSARDYIRAFACLRDRQLITRTINAAATKYYLSRISEEFGSQALHIALEALNDHIQYYEATSKSTCVTLRKLAASFGSNDPKREEFQIERDFQSLVSDSMSDSPEARARRLRSSPRIPTKVTVSTEYFVRNPDVVAEVLVRASGVCEMCHNLAPFLRKTDKSPYLEVHHIIQLAHGGEDTVENAIAVCPNCHRKAHFGLVDA